MFNFAYAHKGQAVLRMWVGVSAGVTKTKKKRKEVLTHTNFTLSSKVTCWSLRTEQSWSRDKGCNNIEKGTRNCLNSHQNSA